VLTLVEISRAAPAKDDHIIPQSGIVVHLIQGRYPLTLQKSRMPQILGVVGDAVVLYREPSTTQEMWYPRFSCRVNKMAVFSRFQGAALSALRQRS